MLGNLPIESALALSIHRIVMIQVNTGCIPIDHVYGQILLIIPILGRAGALKRSKVSSKSKLQNFGIYALPNSIVSFMSARLGKLQTHFRGRKEQWKICKFEKIFASSMWLFCQLSGEAGRHCGALKALWMKIFWGKAFQWVWQTLTSNGDVTTI